MTINPFRQPVQTASTDDPSLIIIIKPIVLHRPIYSDCSHPFCSMIRTDHPATLVPDASSRRSCETLLEIV